jgi:cell wall-associated NlpC family hydrolase
MNKLVAEAMAIQKRGAGYWWGAEGQKPTEELLKKFEAIYGKDHYHLPGGVDASRWIGIVEEVYDCSGYIRRILIRLGILPEAPDISADGFFRSICKKVQENNLQPGDLCFYESPSDPDQGMDHVALYIGNGKIVHAAGTKKGVVIEALGSHFNYFGRLPYDLEEKAPEHWAKKHRDSLIKRGLVIHEERYNDPITRGEIFALLDQVIWHKVI